MRIETGKSYSTKNGGYFRITAINHNHGIETADIFDLLEGRSETVNAEMFADNVGADITKDTNLLMILNDIRTKPAAWYSFTYDDDPIRNDLNQHITWNTLYQGMQNGLDFYELMDCGDSIQRERIFWKMSDIFGTTYDKIYDLWINSK